MKKIEAVMPPFKLDEVKEALEKEKIHRMTVFEVKGAGSQQGKVKCYRGAHYLEDVSEVKVEVVTEDHEVDEVRTSSLPRSVRVISVMAKSPFCRWKGSLASVSAGALRRAQL